LRRQVSEKMKTNGEAIGMHPTIAIILVLLVVAAAIIVDTKF
jgi:hypothetical protein